ncbi:MAG: HAD family phosphatase [Ruminococcus sp.]|nr:HAD family phosphatase [Ruminococcus sp.]
MKLSELDAIVFDMDGVIFDTETIALRSWQDAADAHNIGDITETAMKCVGRSTVDTLRIFEEAYGDRISIEQMHIECIERFKEIVRTEGMPVKVGARELLEHLKASGIKVALASSTSYQTVVDELKDADLFKYFRVIVGGDMIEHSKPEPEIYLLACEKLGADPKRSAAVEDSRNGIISASRAGMMPFLVPDIIEPDEDMKQLAHKQFSNLLEVKDFLES